MKSGKLNNLCEVGNGERAQCCDERVMDAGTSQQTWLFGLILKLLAREFKPF